jgi:hypothetical protein
MPDKETLERAKHDLREGKAPSTAAGELVREEIEHVREGKHGARSPQQAIAIGLSKARRAGVPLEPPKSGSKQVRERAEREYEEGQEHPRQKALSEAHAQQEDGDETRAEVNGFAGSAIAPGQARLGQTVGGFAIGRGYTSSEDQKASWSLMGTG